MCANGVENLIRSNAKNVLFIVFEEFIKYPERYMKEIYEFLGREYYEHDFKDIPDNATDVDGLYFNKFPHKSGKVLHDKGQGDWVDVIDESLASEIMMQFPLYNKSFGYGG